MSESRQLYFGKFPIDERQVFYETENIIGIINISPILPDHVLVIPKSYKEMGAPKIFSEMTPELVSELYIAVHTIQRAIIDNRDIIDFNIAMQDGRSAGQSVPHVHVHILPRKGGEFDPADKVHSELQKSNVSPTGDNSQAANAIADEIRIQRRVGEPGMKKMAAEANEYKRWFEKMKLGGGGRNKKILVPTGPNREEITRFKKEKIEELLSKIDYLNDKSVTSKDKYDGSSSSSSGPVYLPTHNLHTSNLKRIKELSDNGKKEEAFDMAMANTNFVSMLGEDENNSRGGKKQRKTKKRKTLKKKKKQRKTKKNKK